MGSSGDGRLSEIDNPRVAATLNPFRIGVKLPPNYVYLMDSFALHSRGEFTKLIEFWGISPISVLQTDSLIFSHKGHTMHSRDTPLQAIATD